MMAFAVVVTLCSEADAFVAASFGTMRPAAKLAFLVLGPMLDFKLIMMYTRIFRPRLMWTIFTAVVLQVFVYSYVTHVIWEKQLVLEWWGWVLFWTALVSLIAVMIGILHLVLRVLLPPRIEEPAPSHRAHAEMHAPTTVELK
jgi:hypothetical protein